MLGQYVNNYEVTGLLGEGGMGAVYSAQHRLINRKVAIKVLKRELAREPEVVQRFFNEARAIGTIRHPNIIEIIDVGKLPSGVPYLVMELLQGESLSERVTRLGPLPFDVVVDFAAQAACALEVAHERGIVHRDLKPENLFILSAAEGERETLKVLDFGIAKLRDDLTATPVHTRAGSLLGTPLYMSPEQCRGLNELDLRTDVYSLGVILFEAVCGTPPFLAKSVGEVMRMHMSEEPMRPSELRADIPPQLEFVILKCLAKEPEQRFASMPEFSAALEQSGLTSTEPDTPLLIDPRWSKSTRSYPPQTPLAASNVNGQLARDQRRTAPGRVASLRRGPLGKVLQVALWGFLASLVALGAPEQQTLHTRMEPSLAVPPRAAAASAPPPLVLQPVPSTPEPEPEPASLPPAQVARPPVPRTEPSSAPAKPARASATPADLPARRAVPQPAAASSTPPAAAESRAVRSAPPPSATSSPPPAAAEPRAVGTASQSAVAAQPRAFEPTSSPGFLSLDSAPWSEVFLGDSALGTTPLLRVPLPPGRHQLTLRNSELGASTTYVVEIKSGQSLARLVGWGK
jgi:serine/threonine-protein kinase